LKTFNGKSHSVKKDLIGSISRVKDPILKRRNKVFVNGENKSHTFFNYLAVLSEQQNPLMFPFEKPQVYNLDKTILNNFDDGGRWTPKAGQPEGVDKL
jgi:hypothetical protein